MDKELGIKSTYGEYNRLMQNLEVYEKASDEQKEWLEYFLDKYDYRLKQVVLRLENGILCVIINTPNFKKVEGVDKYGKTYKYL